MGLYATASAGGYQIFARTPLPIWEIGRNDPPFRENACLLRPGDRLRLIPIDLEEYEAINAHLTEGTYVFNIIPYQRFSVAAYHSWLDKLEPKQGLRPPRGG